MKEWNPHNLHEESTGKKLEYVDKWTNFQLSLFKNLLASAEERESTVSIIIQGPLNERSINTIPDYLKYGEVIVSCWEDNDLKLLDSHKDKIKIVTNKYSDLGHYNSRPGSQSPWVFQNYTTLQGLLVATGHSSIKLRSDESFPVLDAIINRLKYNRDHKNPETGIHNWFKIITSNIYFRHDYEKKFHPSDHIIAGNTQRMQSIFKESFRQSKQKLEIKFPEQLICKCIIETYRDPINRKLDSLDESQSVKLMQKHFDIVRIRDLPNRIWTSSYRKYDKLFGEEIWCHDIKDIGG